MKRADASVQELTLLDFHPDATQVPTVRIFTDANGNSWQRVYQLLAPDTVNEMRELTKAGAIALEEEPLPHEDFRAVEMAWLQMHQAELCEKYRGEWVAIDGPGLVAHAEGLEALLSLSQEAGHPNPFITAIPEEPLTSLHL